MCKERTTKAKGSTIELISLCKEVNFGERQLETMLLLYHAVFVPRLIYNCEAWSNVTSSDIKMLQNAQKGYGGSTRHTYCCNVPGTWDFTNQV